MKNTFYIMLIKENINDVYIFKSPKRDKLSKKQKIFTLKTPTMLNTILEAKD